jgi:hypothetical protein
VGVAVLTAAEWNALYPPGTPVRVTRADGWVLEAVTASEARRVGQHDMVELAGYRGLWMLGWCEAR